MPSHQQASFRRKLTYSGCILGLFVVTLFLRGLLWVTPESYAISIQGRAEELQGTERNQGKTELAGSAVRLLLTGSRGFAVCCLWIAAQEKQKNNQWNELEVLVDSITQLQPHFIKPWEFQSWNLAYNVSVEMERLSDSYFYIGRGITVGARGEAVNARNPDLRRTVGFYYNNKFRVSDVVKTLRCFMQLSCLEPQKRDPGRLLTGDDLNVVEFEKFVRDNPQLCRRLREKLGYRTPQEIIQFLKENQKLPSRYTDDGKLADRMLQFPILPETRTREGEEPLRYNYDADIQAHLPTTDSNADGQEAGATWYRYALEVVPPGEGRPAETPVPVTNRPPNPDEDEYDPRRYRVPRSPMLVIFRQDYPLAKSAIADRFTQEGWFDKDTPWRVDEGIPPVGDSTEPRLLRQRWFDSEVAIYPSDAGSAKEAWRKAYDLWVAHGTEYGLELSPSRLEELRRTAKLYQDLRGLPPTARPPEPTIEERKNPEILASFRAARQYVAYDLNRNVTAYPRWRDSTYAESGLKEAGGEGLLMKAHKLCFLADQYRRLKARDSKARDLYQEGLATWIKVFEAYPALRKGEQDPYQEEAYQANIFYVRILRLDNQLARRQASVAICDLMRRSSPTVPFSLFDLMAYAEKDQTFSRVEPLPVAGPLDGVDPKTGIPYIDQAPKERVRERLQEKRPTAGPPAEPAGGGAQVTPPVVKIP